MNTALTFREIKVKKAFVVHSDYNIKKDFKYPFHLSAYQGCSSHCIYCYARRNWRRFWSLCQDPEQIIVKINYPEIVEKELSLMEKKGLPLIMRIGTHSEPYNALEPRYRLTRKTLEKFIGRSGWEIRIPTKSKHILLDKDILLCLNVLVTVTITSLYHWQRFEPDSISVYDRLLLLKELKRNGIRTRIRVEPYLEGFTELEEIKKIGRDLGVEEIKVKKLNYYSMTELLNRAENKH